MVCAPHLAVLDVCHPMHLLLQIYFDFLKVINKLFYLVLTTLANSPSSSLRKWLFHHTCMFIDRELVYKFIGRLVWGIVFFCLFGVFLHCMDKVIEFFATYLINNIFVEKCMILSQNLSTMIELVCLGQYMVGNS